MTSEELITFAVAAAGVTTILVQLLKDGVFDPFNIGGVGAQRNAFLRAINYAINLALILLVVLAHHAFDSTEIVTYLALAAGQAVGSHVEYQLLSTAKTTTQQAASLPDPTLPAAPPSSTVLERPSTPTKSKSSSTIPTVPRG